MSFQWLQMRITEEQDRRKREAVILSRLPQALEELHGLLGSCVEAYTQSFGKESAEIELLPSNLRITIRQEIEGTWQEHSKIEVHVVPTIPGFQVDRPGEPMVIEIGVLPGDKVFYRDRESDQYLNMEELTRRILDRGFFPKLGE